MTKFEWGEWCQVCPVLRNQHSAKTGKCTVHGIIRHDTTRVVTNLLPDIRALAFSIHESSASKIPENFNHVVERREC